MEGSALRGRALVLGPKEVRSRKMGLRGASRGGGGKKGGALSGGPPPMGGDRGVDPDWWTPACLLVPGG